MTDVIRIVPSDRDHMIGMVLIGGASVASDLIHFESMRGPITEVIIATTDGEHWIAASVYEPQEADEEVTPE